MASRNLRLAIFFAQGQFGMGQARRAAGWGMGSRAAKPQTEQNERSEILRRAERIASCETARPACRAGQPQIKKKTAAE